ncbi:hypothetical protein OSL46_24640, partial [Escherichia coli]|nr:hypothetical protein [Escherichia coli]
MAIKESQINSTSNINTSNSKVKSDNGFAIICSNLNNENASTIASYKAITFDAVPATKVSRSADVTSYPVQDGNDVSDNVRIKNNKWICPYISRHLLSLNPLQARCRRYSRG